MGTTAIPIILGAISAVGTIQQGRAAKEDADLERQQMEQQAEMIKVEAINQEANRRSMFAEAIASDIAMNAAAGVRNFLGSPQAFTDAQQKELDRDIAIIRLNAASGVRVAQLGASQARSRARSAVRGSALKATGTLLSTAKKAIETEPDRSRRPAIGTGALLYQKLRSGGS